MADGETLTICSSGREIERTRSSSFDFVELRERGQLESGLVGKLIPIAKLGPNNRVPLDTSVFNLGGQWDRE